MQRSGHAVRATIKLHCQYPVKLQGLPATEWRSCWCVRNEVALQLALALFSLAQHSSHHLNFNVLVLALCATVAWLLSCLVALFSMNALTLARWLGVLAFAGVSRQTPRQASLLR